MLAKFATITLFTTLAVTSAFAQKRNFREERAQLAREEKEEKRKQREERDDDDESRPARRPHIQYGTNVIRLSPITAMDVGVGFGLSYEKIFGPDGMIGVVLPAYLMLENRDGYDPFSGSGNYNDNTHYNTYVFFNPGLKIYPFGQRRVTYAVGPSLLLGYGGGNEWQYYNGSGYPYPSYQERVSVRKLHVGMLVNNYVNFNITQGFNLGLEGGIGVRYVDRETYDSPSYMYNDTYSKGISVTGSFSLTLGYRF